MDQWMNIAFPRILSLLTYPQKRSIETAISVVADDKYALGGTITGAKLREDLSQAHDVGINVLNVRFHQAFAIHVNLFVASR
jgi:hypothetical protein